MHEVALAESIVELVTNQSRAHGVQRVTVVHVVVGALASVMPEALSFGFGAASRGSVADGARLEIHEVPGVGNCLDCGKNFEARSRLECCPGCASGRVLLSGGDELRVSELEVD